MEEFFTKVNFRKSTQSHTLSFHPAMHYVILATFAQVGQVRILLDKLSRHVEEAQKRHVIILSNPNPEEGESRTSPDGRNWIKTNKFTLALAFVSVSICYL